MEAHYIGFNMWVQAVEQAGTTDVDAVRQAMYGQKVKNLTGGTAVMGTNHYLTKPVLIGEIQADGQFETVWKTKGEIPGEAWSRLHPGQRQADRRLDLSVGLRQLREAEVRRLGAGRPVSPTRRPESERCAGSGCFAATGTDVTARQLRSALLARLVVWVVLLLAPQVGSAADLPAADMPALVQQLGGKDFAAKIAAVEQIAATADPRAVAVLEAMLAGQLAVRRDDGRVVISETRGAGPAADGSADRRRTRRGRPDGGGSDHRQQPAARRAARCARCADPAQPRSGQAPRRPPMRCSGPAMRRCCRCSSRPRPRSPTPACERGWSGRWRRPAPAPAPAAEQRLAAVDTLEGFADPDVRSLLASVAAGDPEPAVRAAAAKALEHVEQRLALWGVLGNVFQGVSLGSVLLLAAVGLAITFGVMGVINMAHGEMVMLGAYTTFVVQEQFRQLAPGRLRPVGAGGDPDRLPGHRRWSASPSSAASSASSTAARWRPCSPPGGSA